MPEDEAMVREQALAAALSFLADHGYKSVPADFSALALDQDSGHVASLGAAEIGACFSPAPPAASQQMLSESRVLAA